MRILLTAHAFPPHSVAGVEVYTLRLGSALAAMGHLVRVVAAAHDLGRPDRHVSSRRMGAVEVVEINNLHAQSGLRATYRSDWIDEALTRVVEEYRPRCVHIQHLLNLSTGIVAAARRCGAAVVLTLHDHWLSCAREGLRMQADFTVCDTVDLSTCARCLRRGAVVVAPLQGQAMKVAARLGAGRLLRRLHDRSPRAAAALWQRLGAVARPKADELLCDLGDRRAHVEAMLADVSFVVAPTSFMRERARELGIGEERIRVIPVGVPVQPVDQEVGVCRFGYVGTLAPHKGVHVLVRAFQGLPDRSLRLEVHGGEHAHPGYARGLRELASSDGRITFHGAFAEGQQARILGRFDALVVPSLWWEVGPLTLLEARAGGLPVIATRLGSMPELLEGARLSALVPPGDVDALRTAMESLVRAEPAEPAVLRARSVEDEARDLDRLYRSLVESGGLGGLGEGS